MGLSLSYLMMSTMPSGDVSQCPTELAYSRDLSKGSIRASNSALKASLSMVAVQSEGVMCRSFGSESKAKLIIPIYMSKPALARARARL